jgi:hypothetical protein
LISARSRRKLGGATAITPFGSLDGAFPDFSRLMPGIVRKRGRRRNRELGAIPAIHLVSLPGTEGLTKTN